MEEIEELWEYCSDSRIGGTKESQKEVVKGFGLRGALTLTRSEGLVVRPVVSCLGVLQGMGMDVRRIGSEEWRKYHHMEQKGRDIVV